MLLVYCPEEHCTAAGITRPGSGKIGPMIDDRLLSQLQLFQGVRLDSIRDLLANCPLRTYPPGAVLLTPNQKNDRMYLLLSGKVSIRIHNADNIPITYVHQGESIGEMSAHDGLDPSAIVETEVETRVLEISNEVLFRMIDRSHDISRNLLYLLANRIRSGNQVVSSSLRLQKKYEQHANLDNLTSLHNRRWLDNYFDGLFAELALNPGNARLSLLMVDVDHFKKFNDSYGHLAGDEALKAVAAALRTSTRSSDFVARYGGEEFSVILPETAVQDALRVAEKIHQGISRIQPSFEGKSLPALTVSIGIAGLLAEDSAASLQHAADQALYQAKKNGRNQSWLAERHR